MYILQIQYRFNWSNTFHNRKKKKDAEELDLINRHKNENAYYITYYKPKAKRIRVWKHH